MPSAAWGWDEAIRKFGNLTLKEVLQPAIAYAEKGFPISEIIGNGAVGWNVPDALDCHPRDATHTSPYCNQQDPDSIAAWYINGQRPKAGQIFRNSDLARTFRLFGDYGRDVFYKGEIAQAIVAKPKQLGGTMTLQDLRNYYGEWVEAAHTTYKGYDVYETTAPSRRGTLLRF